MTQDYIGTKQVTAWEQDKDGQPGYAVKYADGYTSWSPKAVFEEAYIGIGHVGGKPPHQQRVIGEKAVLDDKLDKLRAFISGNPAFEVLDAGEKIRLRAQAHVMGQYSQILGERISAFDRV